MPTEENAADCSSLRSQVLDSYIQLSWQPAGVAHCWPCRAQALSCCRTPSAVACATVRVALDSPPPLALSWLSLLRLHAAALLRQRRRRDSAAMYRGISPVGQPAVLHNGVCTLPKIRHL